jgi:hypothetical protein
MGAPVTRADCVEGPRPCPWTGCRYALPGAAASCALDVADRGGATLAAVASAMGMTAAGVSHVEVRALAKLRKRLAIENSPSEWRQIETQALISLRTRLQRRAGAE